MTSASQKSTAAAKTPCPLRHESTLAVVGAETFSKVSHSSRILMVGAGGIGCELLKNLVLAGFADIEVVDLDTIDLSNLNRQFLFQKQHIKKSKAHVARESALKFNPNVKIVSHHSSIFELDKFSLTWFKSFNLVLNALDNLPARRHVNMMCMAANVPLVESGTAGYLGQVSVHVKNSSQCFDCEPKPTPKTFPVCTIRSTPSTPIHCIVWSKSFLFSTLFGKEEDEEEDGKKQMATGENEDAKELAELEKEALALNRLREALGTPDFAAQVFKKVYHDDIARLLSMDELWKVREKPTPIQLEALQKKKNGSGIASNDGKKDKSSSSSPSKQQQKSPSRSVTIASSSTAPTATTTNTDSSSRLLKGLERDQTVWDLEYTWTVFKSSLDSLAARLIEMRSSDPDATLFFDKDDSEALDFVTASANLRMHVFGIRKKSRFEVKEMAGNIIPAIATTNAIIAGMIVLQAIQLLASKNDVSGCKDTFLAYSSAGRAQLLQSQQPPCPKPDCVVCSSTYLEASVDMKSIKLESFVKMVVEDRDVGLGLSDEVGGDVCVEESGRLLYDVDFDDNAGKTLFAMGIKDGAKVQIRVEDAKDEHGGYSIIVFIKQDSKATSPSLMKITGIKNLHARPKPVPAVEEPKEDDDAGAKTGDLKRKLGNQEGAPSSKKQRMDEEDTAVAIVVDDDDTILID